MCYCAPKQRTYAFGPGDEALRYHFTSFAHDKWAKNVTAKVSINSFIETLFGLTLFPTNTHPGRISLNYFLVLFILATD